MGVKIQYRAAKRACRLFSIITGIIFIILFLGRVRNGYCFDLITRERHDKLEEQTTPEILRTPLHAVGLSIKLLRLGGISDFLSKALAVPALDVVIEAEAQLKHLNALDVNSELTPLGTKFDYIWQTIALA